VKLKLYYLYFFLFLFSLLFVFKNEIVLNDSVEYFQLAKNIKKGIHYAGDLNDDIDFRLFNKRPLGYPFFYIINPSPWIRKLIQMGFIFMGIFLGLSIMWRSTKSIEGQKLFLCLALLSFPLFMTGSFAMADLLFMVIVTGIWYYLYVSILYKHKVYTNVFITLICIGLLIKPILVPVAYFLILPMLYFLFIKKQFQFKWLMPLILVLVYSNYHKKNIGISEYSSISATNLAQYNARWLIASKFGNDSANNFAATHHLGVPRTQSDYATFQSTLKKQGNDAILSHFPEYLKIQVLGMVKFFIDPGAFEIRNFFNQDNNDLALTPLLLHGKWKELKTILGDNYLSLSLILIGLIIGTMRLLGVLLTVFQLKNPQIFSALIIVGYFAVLVGPLGAFRFLIPVYFPVLILTVLGLELGINLLQKRSIR